MNQSRRRPSPQRAALLVALLATSSALASPFDIIDRVRNQVDEATTSARDAVSSVTGTSDAASNEETGMLAIQALRAGNLTPEQEVAIGTQIAGNLLGAAPLVSDDGLQNYVNRVGRWVAMQTDRADAHWRFGVIQSEDVNAFAAPGGFVFITLGLYRLLDDEAQLAAVLGHEIGHVVRRHHVELLKQSSMLGAVSNVVGNRVGGQSGALQQLIGEGAQILARGLDKDAEFEADRLGMTYAARAGYDPFAIFAVLEKIEAAGNGDEGSLALLYKTHPRPVARLEALANASGNHFDQLPGETLAQRRVAPPAQK